MSRPIILMFLKAPVPGRVKTRLAADVGEEAAAAVYRQLVENQLRHLPPGWEVRIVYDPPGALETFHAWLGRGAGYCAQESGDLGRRLSAGVSDAFSEGYAPVFCIGGDCPNLFKESFAEARALLEAGHEVVFAPAEDGGYVLAGMGIFCPEVFAEIPWSGPETLEVSVKRARDAGRRVALMAARFDVDTLADLERALRETGFGVTSDE